MASTDSKEKEVHRQKTGSMTIPSADNFDVRRDGTAILNRRQHLEMECQLDLRGFPWIICQGIAVHVVVNIKERLRPLIGKHYILPTAADLRSMKAIPTI
jgi:hypothetical protein